MSDNKGSDQPGHTRSLIRASACRLIFLTVKLQILTENHLEFLSLKEGYTISIHYECEGGIEKSVPRITDWHYEAC